MFQELSLVGSLSVAENIFANHQPVNRLNLIRRGELHRRAREILRLFDVPSDPEAPVERLSVAEQQVIEIVKAWSARPSVLLLDEPTSSLTQREKTILFGLVRRLRQQGVAVVYISHHLEEVLELADRVTVLRDGRNVGTLAHQEVTEAAMIHLMVGRDLQDIYGRPGAVARAGVPRVRVEEPARAKAFEDVSFALWPGEIVGLAGLVGAGRTEVGRAIFGAEPPARGLGPDGAWLKYGGDKIWPAPQGWDNDRQWPGLPDAVLDGGPYTAAVQTAAAGSTASVELTSGQDPRSGIQFSRVIKVFDGAARVSFDTTMKNIDTKPRRWGIWQVTQHNAASRAGAGYNKNLHCYCPANPKSIYPRGYKEMFGLGGIHVEVLKDVSFNVTPVGKREAHEMIESLQTYPLLTGVRGQAGVDLEALIEIIQRVSQMLVDNAEIRELDVNPPFAFQHGAKAADVRVIV